ncbi:MAG: radical SAM protein [Clostridia bacterium]|nr:radical SAM protein [Clostridia bacterium]
MPLLPRVARAALHFWEEPCISGTNGSGTVFFSGCSLKCVFCQNEPISHGGVGKDISVERLAKIFAELEKAGAHNINLVNPTHYAEAIRRAFEIYRPAIPVVYNSGGYDKSETLEMLAPFVDIYLMDFKYQDPQHAFAYSGAADYPVLAADAIRTCYSLQPQCIFDEAGIMQKGVIVRHLLLPQATRDAMAVFDWVRQNTPNAYFSIMSQYFPTGAALQMKPINRRVTAREYEKVLNYILDSGFENCYMQERASAAEEYVPPFDFTGV